MSSYNWKCTVFENRSGSFFFSFFFMVTLSHYCFARRVYFIKWLFVSFVSLIVFDSMRAQSHCDTSSKFTSLVTFLLSVTCQLHSAKISAFLCISIYILNDFNATSKELTAQRTQTRMRAEQHTNKE